MKVDLFVAMMRRFKKTEVEIKALADKTCEQFAVLDNSIKDASIKEGRLILEAMDGTKKDIGVIAKPGLEAAINKRLAALDDNIQILNKTPKQDITIINGGIKSAKIINKHLIIEDLDGKRLDVGRVVGNDGEPGKPGINGIGIDGKPGKPGKPGIDGINGRGIKEVYINKKQHLIIVYTDDSTTDAGEIKIPIPEMRGGGAGVSMKFVEKTVLDATTNMTVDNFASPNVSQWTNDSAYLSSVDLTTNVTGILPEIHGGTNQSAYTLGDTLYSSATNTLSKLAGNITTTQKFYAQTGDGVNSAAPSWIPMPTAGQYTYILANIASDIATYYQLISLPDYVPSATASISVPGVSTTPTLLASFATNSGYPGLTTIPAGTYAFHYETRKTAGANNYYSYVELYKRDLAGIETLLITSDDSSLSALNTTIQVTVGGFSATDIILLATDRLVTKFYAVMVSSTATIALDFDDGTAARVQFPSSIVDANSFIPYIGAVANVNLGTKSITSTGGFIGNASTSTILAISRTIAIIGDLTYTSPSFDGSVNVTATGTLATVNANVGSFGSSTAIPSFTVNGKGLITAASTNVVIAPAGTLTGTELNSTVVTSSLTSVGTIVTGVWHGTAVGGAYIDYNTTNLKVTTNQLNTIQDIATTSSPSFIALTCSSGGLYTSSTYGGGSGDYTDITTPQLKITATTSYIRIPHLSADTGISTVYNYQTGKNVYWGEPTDTGYYVFRGRTLYIGNIDMGTVTSGIWHGTVIDGTYLNYNTTNLKVTTSQLNTIQDIATTSTPQFDGLGVGTAATSAAKIAVYGTSGSLAGGAHIQYTATADIYPLFQQLNWSHDNITLCFDCYFDGISSFRSSAVGSNFATRKINDSLNFLYASGVIAGSAITFATALSISSAGVVTANITGALTGNASTATTLQTARNINGVSFNGSADITVTAAAGTLTGTTLNPTVVTSSLTSVGNLVGLTVDTNTLFVDATNHRVGIGTASPWQKATILGNIVTGEYTVVAGSTYIGYTGTSLNWTANTGESGFEIQSTASGQQVHFLTHHAGTSSGRRVTIDYDGNLSCVGSITGISFVGNTAASTITGTTLASNVVTSSLTAVGTIATGVWHGTAIGGAYIDYNTTNLKVTTNQLNTIQDIATTSTPQFDGLGVGTAATSAAKIAVYGTSASLAGAHVQYTATADVYPLFQQLNWSHDNIMLGFDCYFDGAHRSSYSGSNFNIYKIGGNLNFQLASGVTAGSGISFATALSISNVGDVTQSTQCGFSAYLLNTASNVTGDGTVYTVIPDTEIYDNGGCYNNATGVFTARATGKYKFVVGVGIADITSSHTDCVISLVTTSTNYLLTSYNPYAVVSSTGLSKIASHVVYCNLTANDTVHISLKVAGGTKIIDLTGSIDCYTYFTGTLIN